MQKGNKLARLVTVLLGKISVPLPQLVPLGEELQERNGQSCRGCLCAAEKCVGSSGSRKVGRGQGINFWKVFCLLDALSPSHSMSTCSRATCPRLEPLQPQTRALGVPAATGLVLGGGCGAMGDTGGPAHIRIPPATWVGQGKIQVGDAMPGLPR